MPANTALIRLIDYYQSQQFADDVVGQVDQASGIAKLYRQQIVDRFNAHLRNDGIAISDLMIQEQDRFVCADMPDVDLVTQARLYAMQWICDQNHKSTE